MLQETLPDFFKIGLVTKVDKSTGAPVIVKSSSVLPLSLGPSANPMDFLHSHSHEGDGQAGESDVEPIYSPRVKLEYTPPAALPAPFPRTLHIEGAPLLPDLSSQFSTLIAGLPLYLASASFMKHTMNALYSDLAVTLLKVSLNGPPSTPKKDDTSDSEPREGSEGKREKKRSLREKSLFVRFMVTGNARVSGSLGEWEVYVSSSLLSPCVALTCAGSSESTYIFSPLSGLIHKQVINSIHPAPHQAVYDSLSKIFGFGRSPGQGEIGKGPAPGTMCNGHSR